LFSDSLIDTALAPPPISPRWGRAEEAFASYRKRFLACLFRWLRFEKVAGKNKQLTLSQIKLPQQHCYNHTAATNTVTTNITISNTAQQYRANPIAFCERQRQSDFARS
jgi:hypothetical protein